MCIQKCECTSIGIWVAILFSDEQYKILVLSNKAALSLDFVILPLFIYTLVSID